MENEHTPGPWQLMRGGALRGGMDLKIVECLNGWDEWITLTRLECGLPDARLITAAPDLLYALEAVIDDLVGGIIIGEEEGASPAWLAGAEVRLKNARAAIAKARGASC